MAGITPDEGQDYIAEALYPQTTSLTSYTIGLFTNVTDDLTQTSEWADVTQPTGGGYSETSLTAGSWSVASGGVATYPTVSWIATDSWDAAVYGYYIRTEETTPRILHFEYRPDGSQSMNEDDIYSVDLSTNTETS